MLWDEDEGESLSFKKEIPLTMSRKEQDTIITNYHQLINPFFVA